MTSGATPGRPLARQLGFGLVLAFCWSLAATATALDEVVRIGNPLLARYPGGPGETNARPRAIWDMQVFDGKLYLGHGDHWENRGPIDVWTYAGNGTNFVKEATVTEETIWDFFTFDDKLFIPGHDAHPTYTPTYIYINDTTGWVTNVVHPQGIHMGDVALFKGRLYTSQGLSVSHGQRTLVSTNMGATWQNISTNVFRLVVFDDFIFFEGPQNYTYDGAEWKIVTPDLGIGQLGATRRARLGDGLLYAQLARWMLNPTTLYYITAEQIAANGAAMAIPAFTNARIRDLAVRDNVSFVMTAEEIEEDVLYRGVIHASDDLDTWVVAAEFEVPGIPLSFEIYRGQFFVGLGSRPTTNGFFAPWAGPEAGSIWRVVQPATLNDLDPLTPGELTLEASFVPGVPFTLQSSPSLETPVWTSVLTTNSLSHPFTLTIPADPHSPTQFFRLAP